MMSAVPIYVIGFVAQGFFSARTIVQWFMSEKSHRVVSPDVYWICSLVGSILLFTYGWLRNDFSIILGQVISYYIYIWNLSVKGVWRKWPWLIRYALLCLPVIAISYTLEHGTIFINNFFRNEAIPIPLLIWGSAGQVLFTLRFVYQWYYSHRLHQSILPMGFWIISLIGSGIIVSYGLFRMDPVLILGQSVGFIAYLRNIVLLRNQSA